MFQNPFARIRSYPARGKRKHKRKQRFGSTVQLNCDALETRLVPSTVPYADAPIEPITDMTELARRYAQKPDGPTILRLNFDGAPANGVTDHVSAYHPANRNQVIHDVLFRTSEIFAPFNVQVRLMSRSGNVDNSNDGNTTIFIGDHGRYDTWGWVWTASGWQWQKVNNATGAHTPGNHSDYPNRAVRGADHRPNSDPFNIAYVDPVADSGNDSTAEIAQAIAHEAGHTFGLGHVRTVGYDPDPLSPWNAPGTVPEAMSYDSPNKKFTNRPFQITAYNNQPGAGAVRQPALQPWFFYKNGPIKGENPLVTQDSYSFLETVLGRRSTDDRANVADAWAVDPSYTDSYLQTVTPGYTYYGKIDHSGDFDVFNFNSSLKQTVEFRAERTNGVDPVLLVYNATRYGPTIDLPLVRFNDDGAGYPNSKVTFTAQAGETYRIVVGSYASSSTGSYRLTTRQTAVYLTYPYTSWWGISSYSYSTARQPTGTSSWGQSSASYDPYSSSSFGTSYSGSASGYVDVSTTQQNIPELTAQRDSVARASAHRDRLDLIYSSSRSEDRLNHLVARARHSVRLPLEALSDALFADYAVPHW